MGCHVSLFKTMVEEKNTSPWQLIDTSNWTVHSLSVVPVMRFVGRSQPATGAEGHRSWPADLPKVWSTHTNYRRKRVLTTSIWCARNAIICDMWNQCETIILSLRDKALLAGAGSGLNQQQLEERRGERERQRELHWELWDGLSLPGPLATAGAPLGTGNCLRGQVIAPLSGPRRMKKSLVGRTVLFVCFWHQACSSTRKVAFQWKTKWRSGRRAETSAPHASFPPSPLWNFQWRRHNPDPQGFLSPGDPTAWASVDSLCRGSAQGRRRCLPSEDSYGGFGPGACESKASPQGFLRPGEGSHRCVTWQVSLQPTYLWSRQWDRVLLVSCRMWLLLSPVTVTPVLSGRWSWHTFIQSVNKHTMITYLVVNTAQGTCCVVVQSLSGVQLFSTSWTAACQASLSFTISLSLLNLMFIKLVMPSNHLILCRPLILLPSIFPSIRIFSNESALHNRWPKY